MISCLFLLQIFSETIVCILKRHFIYCNINNCNITMQYVYHYSVHHKKLVPASSSDAATPQYNRF